MNDLSKQFIEHEHRTHVCYLLGVDLSVTRGWWAQLFGMLLGGQFLGHFFGVPARRLRSGLGFTAGMAGAGVVHALGHIVSARSVGAPMDTLLVTPIRTFTLYDDTDKTITRNQDVGRAIGGPVANGAVGLGALVVSRFVNWRSLRFFGIASTLLGLLALLPVFGNDGVVLFRPAKK